MYGEISSNVMKIVVSIAVEYGYMHLDASIIASDLDEQVKNSTRRRFHILRSTWRPGGAMRTWSLRERIQYVGKAYAFIRQQGPLVQRQYRLVEHLDESWTRGPLVPGHVHT